jgi:Transposase zinc-binding domain/Putative transposase
MAQAVSLGAIARATGGDLLATRPTTPAQRKVLRSIADCRTDALGGHRDHCDRCGYEHTFWNSCRDRHCPGCGAEARARWLEKRRDELLDVPYFHVVFTIPESLNALALHAPEILYAILLRATGQALLDVAATRLRALAGVLTVLHTWGQTLVFHPHVHALVPGGGFSFDARRWVRLPTGTFLLAVKVLARRFRTLVRNAITEAYDAGTLILPPHIAHDRTALDLLLVRASGPTGTRTSSLPSAAPSRCSHIWPPTLIASPSRTAASSRSTASASRLPIATTRTATHRSPWSSRPPSSSAASSCTSFRRASPASATTASSRTATARPTSQGRARSSDPRANSVLVTPLPIYVSVLSAIGAPCASVLASIPSGRELGSTRHERDFRNLAFALPRYALSCESSARPLRTHQRKSFQTLTRRSWHVFPPYPGHVRRSLDALQPCHAPPPNPRGSILSPRRPAASSN